jgi:transposase
VVCDATGRALAFRLLPGQRSELRASDALLVAVVRLGRVGRVVCDRGYSSASWRAGIRLVGAEPVVPANRTHPTVPYDRAAYRRRHRVEQLWGRLKEWRAVATRYEKTAASYLGALHVAASLDWIKRTLT